MYAMCTCGKLTEVDKFISQLHGGYLDDADNCCTMEALYVAAKLLFSTINNYGKLTPVLMQLGDFQGAV